MRKIFVIAAVILSVAAARAQSGDWGIKGGLNYSGIWGQDSKYTDPKLDFVGGFFGEMVFSESWGASAELLYSGQGYSADFMHEVSGDRSYLNTMYINLPVMANYYITEGLVAKLGVQAGLPIGSRVTSGGVSLRVDNPNFDVSIPVGVSYALDMGLVVDLRYNVGVTNLNSGSDIRNSVLQLTVGWKIGSF